MNSFRFRVLLIYRPRLEEEVKPVLPLRIKLVDDKSKPITPPAPRSGTGSKNLSRMMSRPSEATAETKARTAVSQTPITVFWNYMEPFFKSVDENDLRVLDDTSKFIDPAPFTIPPLGRHYEEHWREAYGYTVHGRSTRRRPIQNGADAEANSPPRVASLRERLLAMLIEENLTVPETSENGGTGDSTPPDEISQEQSASPPPLETLKGINFVHVDERIRQELSQSGLCSFVPKVDYQEDDEICAEMRTLQRRLRNQVCLNHYRKRKLAELVRTKLPSQEFYTLLGEIDKQIEQAYSKRSRVQKQQKKKKVSVTTPSPSPVNTPMEPIPLVETRQKLLAAFSDIIPSQREFLASSAPAALFNAADEAKVLQYAHDSGNWLPIPEQSLHHVKLAKQPAHPVFPALERQRQSLTALERERQSSTVSDRERQPSAVSEREMQSSTVSERERQSSIVFETPTPL
ncbi:hypothetical protein PSACC_02169 [Paramicrosporidium saccamoebae]|uniref:Uncharacterized protein n=1 Tax=Paramicrosporidium saccamoebae TaxID=1246581 RepID=A0A2H9TJW2_9FUNG|nr:hypothetical protein PSACC_02169 [Paramicrosporidium saccamoebae]